MGDEVQFATEDELGSDAGFEVVQLAGLGKAIRVRRLATDEVARLGFIPDLAAFSLLMARFEIDPTDETVDTGELAAEQYRYQGYVAHLAVFKGPQPSERVACAHCGFDHAASLWTPRQTSRLVPADMHEIVRVALNTDLVEAVRPLSTGATPEDSVERADSSE